MEILWKGEPARVREMGSGPAVVLVHGYPFDGAMWSGVARALASRFRVLKPDLPGRGETAAPSAGTIEDSAEFLAAILGELPGPAGVAGFSMGGYVALALARRQPERLGALALVDTRAAADDEAGKAKREEAIATVRSSGFGEIAEGLLPRLLSPLSLSNRDLLERARRIMLRARPETLEADLTAMRDRPDARASLSEIAVPTLVLVGEQDALTPPADSQAMAEAIPGAKLVTVPGAGHLAPMERPGAVAAALSDFLAAPWERPRLLSLKTSRALRFGSAPERNEQDSAAGVFTLLAAGKPKNPDLTPSFLKVARHLSACTRTEDLRERSGGRLAPREPPAADPERASERRRTVRN